MSTRNSNQLPILIADEEKARIQLETFVASVGAYRPTNIVHKLIAECGRASRVFGAPRHLLNATLGPAHRVTTALRTARWLSLHAFEHEALNRPILSNRRALTSYLGTAMAQDRQETVRVIYADFKLRLMDVQVVHRGTRHSCDVDTGLILHRALSIGANSLILVHNHPSGDPKPSAADLTLTSKLAASLREFDVHLVDHIIITRGEARSIIWDRT